MQRQDPTGGEVVAVLGTHVLVPNASQVLHVRRTSSASAPMRAITAPCYGVVAYRDVHDPQLLVRLLPPNHIANAPHPEYPERDGVWMEPSTLRALTAEEEERRPWERAVERLDAKDAAFRRQIAEESLRPLDAWLSRHGDAFEATSKSVGAAIGSAATGLSSAVRDSTLALRLRARPSAGGDADAE